MPSLYVSWRLVATVAIAPLQEHGHILPTFEIASRLIAAGHRVVYVGVEDCRAIVERRGFAFHAICGDVLPLGSLAAIRARAAALRGPAMHAVESSWRAIAARELLAGGAPVECDLAFVDRDWEEAQLVFASTRVALCAITLWGAFPGLRLRDHLIDREVPPLSTRARPTDSLARSLALWAAHGARELRHLVYVERELARVVGAGWPGLVARRQAMRRAFARRGVRTLVVCPRDFDVPRARDAPGVAYVGPCIDAAREAEAVPALPAGPIVYASIGSQHHRAGAALTRTLVDAATGAPWTLVLAAPYAGPRPANVLVLAENAPQLALLARADAAITHGGLGTIKECIWQGVPMLVLPGDHDQPGNAMRVELHGLGVAMDRERLTPSTLRAAVDQLPAMRSRLRAWSAMFRERQRDARHVEIIERGAEQEVDVRPSRPAGFAALRPHKLTNGTPSPRWRSACVRTSRAVRRPRDHAAIDRGAGREHDRHRQRVGAAARRARSRAARGRAAPARARRHARGGVRARARDPREHGAVDPVRRRRQRARARLRRAGARDRARAPWSSAASAASCYPRSRSPRGFARSRASSRSIPDGLDAPRAGFVTYKWTPFDPPTAGLLVRRDIAERYLAFAPSFAALGRTAAQPASVEDCLLVRQAHPLGYQCARRPEMRLFHHVDPGRFELRNALRFFYSHGGVQVTLSRLLGHADDRHWHEAYGVAAQIARALVGKTDPRTAACLAAWELGRRRALIFSR